MGADYLSGSAGRQSRAEKAPQATFSSELVTALLQCGVYGGQKIGTSEGFRQVGDGAIGQTLLAYGWLIVRRNDDDRHFDPRREHRALYIGPGETGHVKVQHDAVRPRTCERVQKRLTARILTHCEVRGSQHARESQANRLLVLDDGDQRSRIRHGVRYRFGAHACLLRSPERRNIGLWSYSCSAPRAAVGTVT